MIVAQRRDALRISLDNPPDDAQQDGKINGYNYPISGPKCCLAKNLKCCHKTSFQNRVHS